MKFDTSGPIKIEDGRVRSAGMAKVEVRNITSKPITFEDGTVLYPSRCVELAASIRKFVRNAEEALCLDGGEVKPKSLTEAEMGCPGYQPGNRKIIEHLLFMCDQIEKCEDIEKAMRWIGFAQGVIWSKDWATLEELRNATREILLKG